MSTTKAMRQMSAAAEKENTLPGGKPIVTATPFNSPAKPVEAKKVDVSLTGASAYKKRNLVSAFTSAVRPSVPAAGNPLQIRRAASPVRR